MSASKARMATHASPKPADRSSYDFELRDLEFTDGQICKDF